MAMYDAGGGYRLRSMRSGNAVPEGEMDALLLGKTRELVAATPSQRNWKGIAIALLVICAVLGLIIFSIYLLLPPDEGPRVKGRKVTVEDVTSSHFVVEPWNGTWISETELLVRDYLGGLSLLNVETLNLRPFIANTTFRRLDARKFFVSPDRKFILFAHEDQPIWQNSFRAKYTVYDIDNEFQIVVTPFAEVSPDQDQPWIQYCTWVPGTTSLIFVHENDIYYKPDPRSSRTSRITTTGQEGVIYHGIPDWLYEAEILKSNAAIWMSGGQYFIYASFNDSKVGVQSYHWYGDNLSYPKLRTLRYPKAGTTNPSVTLSAVNLRSNILNSIPLKPPDQVDIRDHYFSAVKWITKELVVVVWMNRRQNVSIISTCQSPRFQCQEIYTVKNPGTGWLDFIDPPLFSQDSKTCLLRIPWRDGEAGYFRHVVWLDISSRKEIPITRGPFEVTEIVAWDQASQYIYFIAAPQGAPGQRHLYRASEKSSNSTVISAPLCMSCIANSSVSKVVKKYQTGPQFLRDELVELVTSNGSQETSRSPSPPPSGAEEGSMQTMLVTVNVTSASPNASSVTISKRMLLRLSPCLYNKVTFSSDNRFFVRECLGPGVPFVTLHTAPLGRLLYVLDNNTALKQEVADLGLPVIRTFSVEVSDGYKAPVKLYLPPGLREEEEFKFPLVLHVNGEPGSQLVSEKWSLSWNAFLVSQKNYILVEIDGRGTGFQGESNRHAVYRKLGTLEVTDQIEAVMDLVKRLPFIDKDNMAVWGWGYGGYVTTAILALDGKDKDKQLFRCGIAVAPITKWEFHASTFTERYMGLPNFTDNYRGYEDADLTRYVKELQDKNLFIIHGTADIRNHYQHTLHLTKALVTHGTSFMEQIYPDEGHLFKGVLSHLYMTLENFLDSNFDSMDWEDYEKANFLGIQIDEMAILLQSS
ncbi:inactive dipeptidyl peptidase 10 isoform X2 [Folsomia candida]|uniref:inactive dipeptidyl peptidase 10 isoform X2 n=1 Tax=Folsomia candida TaxID=158441 RepID=UPI0016055DDB|nr:inactive dipeptidyl peptidase 10 isoform X2 [Folsomia candida]